MKRNSTIEIVCYLCIAGNIQYWQAMKNEIGAQIAVHVYLRANMQTMVLLINNNPPHLHGRDRRLGIKVHGSHLGFPVPVAETAGGLERRVVLAG